MTQATTTTSTKEENQKQIVEADFFHIDMIPDAMEKMGWVVAPKLMRHWFSISPAYTFTKESKKEALDKNAVNLQSSLVNSDIVKMSWAVNFKQVSSGIDELSLRWKSTKGIARLKQLLNKKGDYSKEVITLGYIDDVKDLDSSAQINLVPIGSKLDTINDWYGAMGNSNLKICVRGKTEEREGKHIFVVDQLGYYLKDTYDFVDESNNSEPLGVWSKNRILNKEETGLYMSTYLSGVWGYLARNFSGFVPVFNSDFRDWQRKHNTGGDFIVFSDVLWMQPHVKDKEIPL